MALEDGLSAIRLEMPERIPRTEYSAHTHWKLVNAVTGADVDEKSAPEAQASAGAAFIKSWNYDFFWNIWVHSPTVFDGPYTRMGHAEYAAGGGDFDAGVSCPFPDVEDVLRFRPTKAYSMRKDALRAMDADYDSLCSLYPGCVNMSGCYVSALSGLIEMFGWEMLLLAAGEDEKRFGEVIADYGKFILQYFELLGRCKSKVIMVHDDLCWTSGPIFRREFYDTYLFPLIKREVSLLKDCGKTVMFTSDGDCTSLLDGIAACGVDGFVVEPCTDLKSLTERYGKTHVIIGNADTRVLLSGSKEEIYSEVKRCIDLGKNCPGYFMAVGNHIPANTPVENALYYNEAYEKLSHR